MSGRQRQRRLLIIAGVIGFLAVALGAFGAHALKSVLGEAARTQYDLGIRYAYIHLFAIMSAALALPLAARPGLLYRAGWFFTAGIALFSGSLLLLALSGQTIFAFATPVGGVLLLCGWALFVYAFRER